MLAETRRHAKEMAAQRELADKAEASRFTDLRTHLNEEISRVMQQVETSSQAVQARVDRLEIGLRETSPDGQLQQLAALSERHANDIQSRVDRLEIGLREMEGSKRSPVAVPSPAAIPTAWEVAPPAIGSGDPLAKASPGLDPTTIRY